MDMRFILGLPFAAAITAALFVLMAALIRQDAQIIDAPEGGLIKILPIIKDSSPPRVRRTGPEPLKDPPPIERPKPSKSDKPTIDTRGVDPISPGERDVPIGPLYRSATIKVAPQYPEQCRARGAEGKVIVQFDVTDRGETTNIRIVSSADSCFERAVVRAVQGWRYPPEMQRDLVEVFDFQLEQ